MEDVVFFSPAEFSIMPRWYPTPLGTLKLNFGGSAIGNPGIELTGIHGIIRSDKGSFVLSFSGLEGHCTTNQVELISLNSGLLEAYSCNLQGILFEVDSFCII